MLVMYLVICCYLFWLIAVLSRWHFKYLPITESSLPEDVHYCSSHFTDEKRRLSYVQKLVMRCLGEPRLSIGRSDSRAPVGTHCANLELNPLLSF